MEFTVEMNGTTALLEEAEPCRVKEMVLGPMTGLGRVSKLRKLNSLESHSIRTAL